MVANASSASPVSAPRFDGLDVELRLEVLEQQREVEDLARPARPTARRARRCGSPPISSPPARNVPPPTTARRNSSERVPLAPFVQRFPYRPVLVDQIERQRLGHALPPVEVDQRASCAGSPADGSGPGLNSDTARVDHPSEPDRPSRRQEVPMQKLRNLRLAVRLGVAFGALALGLARRLRRRVLVDRQPRHQGRLARRRRPRATRPWSTASPRGAAERVAHKVAQHLYVHDGDLATQDKVAAEIEELARGRTRPRSPAWRSSLSSATTPRRARRADGAKQLPRRLRRASSRPAAGARGVAPGDRRRASRSATARATSTPSRSLPALDEARGRGRRERQGRASPFAAGEGRRRRTTATGADQALDPDRRRCSRPRVALALAVFTTRSVTRPVHALRDRLDVAQRALPAERSPTASRPAPTATSRAT